jgi:hypothetical protein
VHGETRLQLNMEGHLSASRFLPRVCGLSMRITGHRDAGIKDIFQFQEQPKRAYNGAVLELKQKSPADRSATGSRRDGCCATMASAYYWGWRSLAVTGLTFPLSIHGGSCATPQPSITTARRTRARLHNEKLQLRLNKKRGQDKSNYPGLEEEYELLSMSFISREGK